MTSLTLGKEYLQPHPPLINKFRSNNFLSSNSFLSNITYTKRPHLKAYRSKISPSNTTCPKRQYLKAYSSH